ncbi:GNL1 protein, partial [Chaetorhynchus papuensis]|nr:GNL1 protein [Chaetorhynchus papuensis]
PRPAPPGLPNAGKSSVLNALLARGAVGVSRAPGRTRYFQTHFLTPSVRLCDCPGLVFPSRAPPELQVLSGCFGGCFWGGFEVLLGWFWGCFWGVFSPPAWAEKRGYRTARAARSDVARAANGILRLAAEGRLRLCLTPPGYSAQKGTPNTPKYPK